MNAKRIEKILFTMTRSEIISEMRRIMSANKAPSVADAQRYNDLSDALKLLDMNAM